VDTKEFKSKMARFKSSLAIDKHSLDDQIEEQSALFFEVCEAFALAQSMRDEAKTALDEQYAICADEYRRTLDKATEGAIKEAVAIDKEYLDAVANLQERQKQMAMIGAMRDAYESRGRMLRELAQLYISGYFTLSGVSGGQSSVRQARADSARAAMSERRRPRVGSD